LILLAKVGQLDLLRAGVPEILVPDVVLREVGARGPTDSAFQEIQRMTWLRVIPAPPTPRSVLVWNLGPGESSVLAVALKDPDSEAILDDRGARRCAQALKVGFRGTLGLVVLAKQIGFIPSARPVIEQLRQAGLFVTDDLANRSLALVGE
jgi:predicted nucleic acid-binding protein